MLIECYAQRLLNPFRGTMQVIKYASAEAVSTDGVHWDIYVSNDELRRGLEGQQVQTSDIRYGSWSADKGLKRGPLYPSDDFCRMERMGAVVYEHLLRVHEQVPFPLLDHYEYWLLDSDARPLALIDSALTEAAMPAQRRPCWRPGMAAQERFQSPACQENVGQVAADMLADYINALAGATPSCQWFKRQGEAGGLGMAGMDLAKGLEGRHLADSEFPELLLRRSGHDVAHQRLIEDFLAWQAVWLLTLPLRESERLRLEGQVRHQAILVEGVFRLYPEVIDTAAINAARVESVLRKSQGSDRPEPLDEMSSLYPGAVTDWGCAQ
jgi:hypothetical protein